MAEHGQTTEAIIRMQNLALIDAWNDLGDPMKELKQVQDEYRKGIHTEAEWRAYEATFRAERAQMEGGR